MFAQLEVVLQQKIACQKPRYYCLRYIIDSSIVFFWGLDVGAIKNSIAKSWPAKHFIIIDTWFINGRLTLHSHDLPCDVEICERDAATKKLNRKGITSLKTVP